MQNQIINIDITPVVSRVTLTIIESVADAFTPYIEFVKCLRDSGRISDQEMNELKQSIDARLQEIKDQLPDKLHDMYPQSSAEDPTS